MGNAHLRAFKISGQDTSQLPEPPSSDESFVTQKTNSQCCNEKSKSGRTCLSNSGRYNGRERCRFINGSRTGVVTDLPFNIECGSLSSSTRDYLRRPHRHYHLSSYECEALCNNNDEKSLSKTSSEAGKLNKDEDNKTQTQCIDDNNPYLSQSRPQTVQEFKYPLNSPNTIPVRNFLIQEPFQDARESEPTFKTINNIPDRKQYYPTLSDEQFPIKSDFQNSNNDLGTATPNLSASNNEKESLPLSNNILDDRTENVPNLNRMLNSRNIPKNGSSNPIPNENSYILNDAAPRENNSDNTPKNSNDFFQNDNQPDNALLNEKPLNKSINVSNQENSSNEGAGITNPNQLPPNSMQNIPDIISSGENQNVPSKIKENQSISQNQQDGDRQPNALKIPNNQPQKDAQNRYNQQENFNNIPYKNREEPFISLNPVNSNSANDEENFPHVNLSPNMEKVPNQNLKSNSEQSSTPNALNSEQGKSSKHTANNDPEIEEKLLPNAHKSQKEIVPKKYSLLNTNNGTSSDELEISNQSNPNQTTSKNFPVKQKLNVPNPNKDKLSSEGEGNKNFIEGPRESFIPNPNQRPPKSMKSIPNKISSGENQNVASPIQENPNPPNSSNAIPNRISLTESFPNSIETVPNSKTIKNNPDRKEDYPTLTDAPYPTKPHFKNSKNVLDKANPNFSTPNNEKENLPLPSKVPDNRTENVPNLNSMANPQLGKYLIPIVDMPPRKRESFPTNVSNSEHSPEKYSIPLNNARIQDSRNVPKNGTTSIPNDNNYILNDARQNSPNINNAPKIPNDNKPKKVSSTFKPINDNQNVASQLNEKQNVPTNIENGTQKNELKISNPNNPQENTSNNQQVKERLNVSNLNNDKPSTEGQGIHKNIIDGPRESIIPNQQQSKDMKNIPNTISSENQNVPTTIQEDPNISHNQPKIDIQPNVATSSSNRSPKDTQKIYNPQEFSNVPYKNSDEPFISVNPANDAGNFPDFKLSPNLENKKVRNQMNPTTEKNSSNEEPLIHINPNIGVKDFPNNISSNIRKEKAPNQMTSNHQQSNFPNFNGLNSEEENNLRPTARNAPEIENKFLPNAQKLQKNNIPTSTNNGPIEIKISNLNNPQENTSNNQRINAPISSKDKPSSERKGFNTNITEGPRESIIPNNPNPNQRPPKSMKKVPNRVSSGKNQNVASPMQENPNPLISSNTIPNRISLAEPFLNEIETAPNFNSTKNNPDRKQDYPALRNLPFPLKPQSDKTNNGLGKTTPNFSASNNEKESLPLSNNILDNRTGNVPNLDSMTNPQQMKYQESIKDLPNIKRDDIFSNSTNASNSEHSPGKYSIPLNNARIQDSRNINSTPKIPNEVFPNDNKPKTNSSTGQPVNDTQYIASKPNIIRKSLGENVSRNTNSGTTANEINVSRPNNFQENTSNDQPIKKMPNVPNPNNIERPDIHKSENIPDAPRESLIPNPNQQLTKNMKSIPNIISSGENQNVPSAIKENQKISDNQPNVVPTSSGNQPPKDASNIPHKINKEPFITVNATSDVEKFPDLRLSPNLEKEKVPNHNMKSNSEQSSSPKGNALNSEQGKSSKPTASNAPEIEFLPSAHNSRKEKVPTNDSPLNDKLNIPNSNRKQPVKDRLNIQENTKNETLKDKLKISNPNNPHENTVKQKINISSPNNDKLSERKGIHKNTEVPKESLIYNSNQQPSKKMQNIPNTSGENQNVPKAIKENPKISHAQTDRARKPSALTKQIEIIENNAKIENKYLPNDQKSPKNKIPANGSLANDTHRIPNHNIKQPLREKLNVPTNINNGTPADKPNSLNPNNLPKHKGTTLNQPAKGNVSRPDHDQPSKDNSNISNDKIHKIETPKNMQDISNPNRIHGRELLKNAPNAPIQDAIHKSKIQNVSTHNNQPTRERQPEAQTIGNQPPKHVSNSDNQPNKNYLNPNNIPIHFDNQYRRNKQQGINPNNDRLLGERDDRSNNKSVRNSSPNNQTSTRDKLNKVPILPIKHNKPQNDGQNISKPQNRPISNFTIQPFTDKLNDASTNSTKSKNKTFKERRNIQNSNNNNIGNTPHSRRDILSAPNNTNTPISERLYNKPSHKKKNVSSHSSNNDDVSNGNNKTKDHLSSSSTKSLPSKVNIPNRKCAFHPYSRRQCSPEIITPRVRKASSSKGSIRPVETLSNLNNNHSNTTIFVGINNNFMLPFSSAIGMQFRQCNFDDPRSRSARSEYHQGYVRSVERALLGDKSCMPRFAVAEKPSDLVDITEYYCGPSYACSPSTSASSDCDKDLYCSEESCYYSEDPCYYQLYNLQQETTPKTLPILGLDSEDEEFRKKRSITTIMEDTNNNTNVSLQVLETVENLSGSSDEEEDEILRCLRQLDKLSAKTQALLAESSPNLITENGNQQQHDTFTQSTFEFDDLSDMESPTNSSADLNRPLLESVSKKSSSKVRIVHFNIPKDSKS